MVLAIAADSIRALLHQRLLLGLMVASLALTIGFSVMLKASRRHVSESFERQADDVSVTGTNKLSEKEQRQMREAMEGAESAFQAAFYGVASFGGTLVTLFIFCTTVTGEIRRGTIRVTLSKPVSRPQFLLGKYFGGVAVMVGYWVIVSVAMLAFTGSERVELSPAMRYAPWLMFCKHLMLGSVAMLLSLFARPILAAVVAFFVSADLMSSPNPLYYILPSYSPFNMFGQIMMGQLIAPKDVILLSLYAIDIILIVLLLALWRFRSKELI